MKEITIPNSGKVTYYTSEDIANEPNEQVKEFLNGIYNLIKHMSELLNIPCPYIGLSKAIILQNEYDGSISEMAAMSYHAEDYPELDNSIVQLSLNLFEPDYMTGVIAHELRHIYQKIYTPDLLTKYAQGYGESLYNPAEIDADAFGIWYLKTCPGGSYEKAASILCPEELINDPKAVQLRIEKAKKIADELEQQRIHQKSILNKLKNYIYLKLGGKKHE